MQLNSIVLLPSLIDNISINEEYYKQLYPILLSYFGFGGAELSSFLFSNIFLIKIKITNYI